MKCVKKGVCSMSIRPVDAQILAYRAPEIGRTTNHDGSRAEAQNNQFSNSFQKLVEQQKNQVTDTNKAEHSGVDKDGRKGGNEGGGKKKRPPRGGTAASKDEETAGKSMLDIKV